MPDRIELDVHAHLVPVDPDRLASIEGVEFDSDAQVMTLDGHRLGLKPLFRPQALIGWMDDNAVEHAWISAPPPLYRQHLRGPEARQWANYINEGLLDIAAASGGRLAPLLHLPTEDPEIALSVAADAIARGHNRFAMPSGTGDERGLSDAGFEPLWQTLDAARAFVFFHPGECADGRLKSFYLANLVGNPYETTVAIAHLVFGGVLERYSGLTVCFAHGGGMTPMVAGRLQRGYDTDRPGLDTTRARPEDLLRRIHVDCICHGAPEIDHAEAVFGKEQVLFGSDWPFPMGILDPESQLASLSPEARTRITRTNPARLARRLG